MITNHVHEAAHGFFGRVVSGNVRHIENVVCFGSGLRTEPVRENRNFGFRAGDNARGVETGGHRHRAIQHQQRIGFFHIGQRG